MPPTATTAPIIAVTSTPLNPTAFSKDPSLPAFKKEKMIPYDINVPYSQLTTETNLSAAYPHYLPTWEPIWFDPLPEFEFSDPALRVAPQDRVTKPHLLSPAVKVTHIQPGMGSIVHGIQLNTLSDAGKDELALLISERKVLAFPDQDLIDSGPEFQQNFMKYFGKPNYQPVSGSIPGYPGFHIIHRNGNAEEIRRFLEKKSTTTLWHQDVSYERQPPGYVMLGLLEGPEVGGDTVFADTAAAYNHLSPMLKTFLDKLTASHSSKNMIIHTRMAGGLVRKDPVDSIHPLVRVHPVTEEKSLFINGEFITQIHELKETEMTVLLNFLLQHIITGHDFQARVKWQPRTIVMFDNRSTLHTAVVDYVDGEKGAAPRHIFRLCAMAEKPLHVVA